MDIPEDAIPGLFQRVAPLDSSDTRARGGTGLELAICKQPVELMDGGITLRSVETLGISFAFWFTAEADVAPASARPLPQARLPRPNPLRILVDEGNPTAQHVLRAFLDLGGHVVTMAGNGRDRDDRAKNGRST